jgi:hypothetical protein
MKREALEKASINITSNAIKKEPRWLKDGELL